MATQSIKKNIVIHDKDSAAAFVEALEKAEVIATKPLPLGCRIKEINGEKNIREFFGDRL